MRSSQSLLLLLVTLTANHPSIQAYPQSKTTTTQSLATPTPTPTTTAKAIEASRTENSTREVAVVTTEAAESNSSMNEDSGKDSDNKPGWDEQDDDEDYSDQFDWECGTDYFTKLVSESTIDRDCPELKVIINSCCLAHDDCYDKQLGRTFCDDTFCACLDNVTQPSAVCSKEDSPTFCELVRHFGEAPYNASATTPATTSTTAKTTIE
ncbi:unnamed protein product [Anisakis simplex]|uniref:Phospholipase A2-like protein (inferred by orthology to a C. elegans protein) n=1 Tax=Anisakis simplex TaxID=6269 RepID=A0A0M3K717_ANISI|nr:unnamed protein product [Anisakis simplex]